MVFNMRAILAGGVWQPEKHRPVFLRVDGESDRRGQRGQNIGGRVRVAAQAFRDGEVGQLRDGADQIGNRERIFQKTEEDSGVLVGEKGPLDFGSNVGRGGETRSDRRAWILGEFLDQILEARAGGHAGPDDFGGVPCHSALEGFRGLRVGREDREKRVKCLGGQALDQLRSQAGPLGDQRRDLLGHFALFQQ